MRKEELKERTKRFALRVMKLADALPNTTSGRAIANQLVRSGTSVGSNYRAACRGRSKAEFTAKLGIVLEEIDESAYWLELIIEGKLMKLSKVESLYNEAKELTAIFSSAVKSSKSPNLTS